MSGAFAIGFFLTFGALAAVGSVAVFLGLCWIIAWLCLRYWP